ncbi:hypothetical protein GCM10027269_48660 [Kribbella endophytica]
MTDPTTTPSAAAPSTSSEAHSAAAISVATTAAAPSTSGGAPSSATNSADAPIASTTAVTFGCRPVEDHLVCARRHLMAAHRQRHRLTAHRHLRYARRHLLAANPGAHLQLTGRPRKDDPMGADLHPDEHPLTSDLRVPAPPGPGLRVPAPLTPGLRVPAPLTPGLRVPAPPTPGLRVPAPPGPGRTTSAGGLSSRGRLSIKRRLTPDHLTPYRISCPARHSLPGARRLRLPCHRRLSACRHLQRAHRQLRQLQRGATRGLE